MALHWATALCIVAAFALIFAREFANGHESRNLLLTLHRDCGTTVLLLTLLRLMLRWPLGLDRSEATLPLAWPMKLAALGSHASLYLLLLAQPLLGWMTSNAHGQSAYLAGLIPLPALLPRDRDLADSLDSAHTLTGWILLGVIGLHTAAALWHHYWRRDSVLLRMLPPLRKVPVR